jgi:hypothetical protein
MPRAKALVGSNPTAPCRRAANGERSGVGWTGRVVPGVRGRVDQGAGFEIRRGFAPRGFESHRTLEAGGSWEEVLRVLRVGGRGWWLWVSCGGVCGRAA